jgi:hypothetical protein
MGVDCSFGIYPPLERTKANQEQYELFLREALDTYGPRDGDDAEQRDGGSVVLVNAESEKSYIDFEVGEQKHSWLKNGWANHFRSFWVKATCKTAELSSGKRTATQDHPTSLGQYQ